MGETFNKCKPITRVYRFPAEIQSCIHFLHNEKVHNYIEFFLDRAKLMKFLNYSEINQINKKGDKPSKFFKTVINNVSVKYDVFELFHYYSLGGNDVIFMYMIYTTTEGILLIDANIIMFPVLLIYYTILIVKFPLTNL